MKTLIELYDERPLENVLAVEALKPEHVVYICADAAAADVKCRKMLERYYAHRGIATRVSFVSAERFDAAGLLHRLRDVVDNNPDCALDITGGTDAALFAAGLLSAEYTIPVFTYSRKKNCFFNIRNAEFLDGQRCEAEFNVEDFFLMAGGAMRTGRVDNAVLDGYKADAEPFFKLYLKHRRQWNRMVTWFQRASQLPKEAPITLHVQSSYQVKGERGTRIDAPEEALQELERMDFIRDLWIDRGRSVSFRFRDEQIRYWLRDVGSVLELYVYHSCQETGLFQDVRCSAIVDWEEGVRENAVSNELDVVAVKGVVPVFISCKTCAANTEALNELAILRDRFGGDMARAAIVTAENGGLSLRNRAAELRIDVIDLRDLSNNRIEKRLKAIMNRMD